MKFLYYSPIPWPHLEKPLGSFPHDNSVFDAEQGMALYHTSLRLFREAEDAGFDWLGVGEEHMNAYGVVPNPCLIAAALASITRSARIAVLGNPLPILNPLRVAEEYAMIDILSHGRLIAGFPRGVPQNYSAYGVDTADSMRRLIEGVEFVLHAWEERGPFDWRGEFYRYEKVSIWPKPTRRPELVFSGRSPESIALAIKHRAVIGELYVRNAEVLTSFINSVRAYQDQAGAGGWEAGAERFLLSVPCLIASNDLEARRCAEQALRYQSERLSGSFEREKAALKETYYGAASHLQITAVEDVEARISYGGLICGAPSAVTEQIQHLAAKTGAGIIGLQMQFGNLTAENIHRSIKLFGSSVRPRLVLEGYA